MLSRIDKFRKQIAGKHRLHEPDWSPLGHLAETQSRRETLDAKLTPERGRGQVLALWLRLQTKPYWFRDQRERGGGLRHHSQLPDLGIPSSEKIGKILIIFSVATGISENDTYPPRYRNFNRSFFRSRMKRSTRS